METMLPKEIAWRKDKQHFIVPQNGWFRSELREEVLSLLKEEWITAHLGLIDREKLSARYNAYLRQTTENGRLNFKDIFVPIALELWARRFEKYLCPVYESYHRYSKISGALSFAAQVGKRNIPGGRTSEDNEARIAPPISCHCKKSLGVATLPIVTPACDGMLCVCSSISVRQYLGSSL